MIFMSIVVPQEKQRQRAPSKRSLETRARILDAAERLFAERGFEGASLRDMAKDAGVHLAQVNFHGGSKEELFFTVVARRAGELSGLRVQALERLKAKGQPTIRGILESFMHPYLDKAARGGPQWLAYARLIAHVSADSRWRNISEACFDPVAMAFAAEIVALHPGADRRRIAAALVFSVSAMLSLTTSHWRIDALAGRGEAEPDIPGMETCLVDFCEAGIRTVLP
jgi:AcrR family transcriptional regulator